MCQSASGKSSFRSSSWVETLKSGRGGSVIVTSRVAEIAVKDGLDSDRLGSPHVVIEGITDHRDLAGLQIPVLEDGSKRFGVRLSNAKISRNEQRVEEAVPAESTQRPRDIASAGRVREQRNLDSAPAQSQEQLSGPGDRADQLDLSLEELLNRALQIVFLQRRELLIQERLTERAKHGNLQTIPLRGPAVPLAHLEEALHERLFLRRQQCTRSCQERAEALRPGTRDDVGVVGAQGPEPRVHAHERVAVIENDAAEPLHFMV